jgi:hypothetical protein
VAGGDGKALEETRHLWKKEKHRMDKEWQLEHQRKQIELKDCQLKREHRELLEHECMGYT